MGSLSESEKRSARALPPPSALPAGSVSSLLEASRRCGAGRRPERAPVDAQRQPSLVWRSASIERPTVIEELVAWRLICPVAQTRIVSNLVRRGSLRLTARIDSALKRKPYT